MISFASIAPHPPILLPSIGSKEDRQKVKETIENLEILGKKLHKADPDLIIISSPHSDWGFDVPLFFLAPNFKGEIKKHLMGLDEPVVYFERGKKTYHEIRTAQEKKKKKIAVIASGDLSHCLKEEGPYGFNPEGPKFDEALIELLRKKDIQEILKLNDLFPAAGECGLRSFCFLLGILEAYSEASGKNWQPEILSYEGPFGVGYLVAQFKFL